MKERFFRGMLRHRKLVVALFALCAVAGGLCMTQVEVNGDLTDYLPEDCDSTKALDAMSEAFDGDIVNTRVYVEGISLAQAQGLAETYGEMQGVLSCTWLGDNVDIYEPLGMQDQETVEAWKTDEGYLFQVTIEAPYEEEKLEQLRAVAQELDGAGTVAIDGTAAITAGAIGSVSGDLTRVMIVCILAVLVVMGLATSSLLHPVIALLTIGVAILMNLGSNIVQGEVSFVTQLVAAVLQLAVSMDYSIVVLNTYRRCREAEPDPFEAMVRACTESFGVVISSAAVTFFGFLSLACMRYLIGYDLGIVLAKGIACSFLTTMFLMPCLVYMLRRPCDKLGHRPVFTTAGTWAKVCRALAVPAAVVVALIAVPCYIGQEMTDFEYGFASLVSPDSQLGEDQDVIAEKFGEEQMWIVMVPDGQWGDENALVEDLQGLSTTTSVLSYSTAAGSSMPTGVLGEDVVEQLISGGYSRIVLTSNVANEGEQTFALVETVRELCEGYYGDDYYLAGDSVSIYDIKEVTTEDASTVRLVSMLAIALVLLVMFRSLSLPVILVFTIEVSVWINMAIPYFTGGSIAYLGYLTIEAVQLGAAVDYSIIFTHEYLRLRREAPARTAAWRGISHSTLAILNSSVILMIAAIAIYTMASSPMVQSLGMLIARGVLLADVLIFLVLPLLFIVLDWVIRHTSIGLGFFDPKKAQATAGAQAAEPALEGATDDDTVTDDMRKDDCDA